MLYRLLSSFTDCAAMSAMFALLIFVHCSSLALVLHWNEFAARCTGRNQFHFYLCLDCEEDPQPRETDVEEWISVEPGYTLSEIREMLHACCFNTTSTLLAMLALEKLGSMGYDS